MDTTVWLVLGAVAALTMLASAVVLLVRVFRARKLLVDAGIPLRSKALVWAAVIYTVSPVDLLPDPVYLDDIGFLLVALRSLHSAASAAGVRTGTRAKNPLLESRLDAAGRDRVREADPRPADPGLLS
ncbi:YkvA family protein [Streptomyces sp. rh34]|uniref:YkvA family protein n=1 Tax=Streptomyces sp. rh34 TaxID=2034272 RepID=UPI000BEFF61F|nr:YkvA family protein [Streptomyces sp. rh34]